MQRLPSRPGVVLHASESAGGEGESATRRVAAHTSGGRGPRDKRGCNPSQTPRTHRLICLVTTVGRQGVGRPADLLLAQRTLPRGEGRLGVPALPVQLRAILSSAVGPADPPTRRRASGCAREISSDHPTQLNGLSLDAAVSSRHHKDSRSCRSFS